MYLQGGPMSFDLENLVSDLDIRGAVLYFKGNVDSEVINKALDLVEGKLFATRENPRVRKKVYNVLVESLQNMYHHADLIPRGYHASRPDRFGLVVMEKLNRGYRVTTCNFVAALRVKELEEKLTRINRSTAEEIKELYKDILNHQEITEKGLGGLGLLDIARKTGHRLDFRFRKYDNLNTAFRLTALVATD